MKRFWVLAVFASCSSPIPQYMQDAPRSEQDARRIQEEIRRELGDGFLVDHIESVFFVASNDGRVSLDACQGTMTRVYRFLTADYFKTKPAKPIRVFLFRNKETYEEYCKKTYGRPPSTPYGFYMSDERKMVMDISTGRGTLAHELVHPILAEDFPGVPAWFNEGFASLFEQSRSTRDGKMEGLVNWRLPNLQKAINSGKPVSLEALARTSTAEFYSDDRPLNYAAARYLCLYLQERGLLRKFYSEFRKNHDADPTGIETLESVAGTRLPDLERQWKDWVKTLRWND